MSNPPKRVRQKQLHFYVTDEELDLINQKRTLTGTLNMGAYLRKLAIDGHVTKLDIPELNELTSLIGRIAGNENQIAKRVNETGNVYEADLAEIKANQAEIYEGIRKILDSLSNLSA